MQVQVLFGHRGLCRGQAGREQSLLRRHLPHQSRQERGGRVCLQPVALRFFAQAGLQCFADETDAFLSTLNLTWNFGRWVNPCENMELTLCPQAQPPACTIARTKDECFGVI